MRILNLDVIIVTAATNGVKRTVYSISQKCPSMNINVKAPPIPSIPSEPRKKGK
jgi:hypothetical protein